MRGTECLVAVALLASLAAADDWPMFGHDPQRTGLSRAVFPTSTLQHLWSTPPPRALLTYVEGTPYWSCPAVAEVQGIPMVFIGCYDHNVYALDARDGRQLWAYITGDCISATPAYAVVGGRPMLFVASSDRHIYALDPRAGLPPDAERALWKFETFPWAQTVNPSRMANPLIATVDGRQVLYCGVWNNDQSGVRNIQRGEVIAFEAATGKVLWRRTIGTGPINTPCLGSVGGEPALFVPYQPGAIFAISARDGRDLWPKPYPAGEEIYSGLSVARVEGRQLIFLGGRTAWAYCVDAETGKQLWATNIGTWVDSTPAFAVIDGTPTVFFGTYTYFLFACDARTGKEIWRYRTRGIIQGSPAIATMAGEPIVCVNSLDNHVYVLSARDGRFIFRYHLGDFPWGHFLKGRTIWASCVVGSAGGQAILVAPSYSGVVHAFASGERDDNAGPPRDSFFDALGEAYTIPVLAVVVVVLALTFRRLLRMRRGRGGAGPAGGDD